MIGYSKSQLRTTGLQQRFASLNNENAGSCHGQDVLKGFSVAHFRISCSSSLSTEMSTRNLMSAERKVLALGKNVGGTLMSFLARWSDYRAGRVSIQQELIHMMLGCGSPRQTDDCSSNAYDDLWTFSFDSFFVVDSRITSGHPCVSRFFFPFIFFGDIEDLM